MSGKPTFSQVYPIESGEVAVGFCMESRTVSEGEVLRDSGPTPSGHEFEPRDPSEKLGEKKCSGHLINGRSSGSNRWGGTAMYFCGNVPLHRPYK